MSPTPSNIKANTSPPEADPAEPILKKLMQVLKVLRREGHTVTIRICPHCKSPRLRFLETYYDIGGVMGITPTKYLCPQCGYWSRIIIEATNEDIDEAMLDDLFRGDIDRAQKLLDELDARRNKD